MSHLYSIVAEGNQTGHRNMEYRDNQRSPHSADEGNETPRGRATAKSRVRPALGSECTNSSPRAANVQERAHDKSWTRSYHPRELVPTIFTCHL